MFWKSDEIADDATASSLRNRIKGYFSDVWGTDISVEKVLYDMFDMVTEEEDEAFKAIYTVTLIKMIDGPSFTMAMALQEGFGPMVTVTQPW